MAGERVKAIAGWRQLPHGPRQLRYWCLAQFLWEITQPFRAALSRRELGTVVAGLPRDAMLAVLSLSRGKPAPTFRCKSGS